jgi:hypothetical protein
MAYLFIVREKAVTPTPEVLTIEPFKSIWERDTDPNKVRALNEFKYIEFLTSRLKTNPYKGYAEDLRDQKLREDCYLGDGWAPDELVTAGIDKVHEFQRDASSNYQYLLAALTAAETLKEFFINPAVLHMVNERGTPVYKPKDVTNALKDTSEIIKNLAALETKVEEELYSETKVKSGKRISPFAKMESYKNKNKR